MFTMKKITVILLALCLVASLVAFASCGEDPYEQYEETPEVTDGALDLETQEGAVTAPPVVEDTEDNAYINAAPANDEQGWGALTPRP